MGGGGCRMSMWSHAYMCVCVCVSEKYLDKQLCVRVHQNEKKVPDKIATTTSDTSDTSRNQQLAQCKEKFNMRERLVFFFSQSLPSSQKKERSSLLNLHMFQSTCFRT